MRVVPANRGWGWLAAGWQLFKSSPGMWTLLVFGYWLLVALVEQIRYVVPLIVAVSLPAFSVSFMAMCDAVSRGRGLQPVLLLAGFRSRFDRLLVLGGLYLVSMLIVLGLTTFIDRGVLFQWMMWGKPPSPEALEHGELLGALAFAAALATPVLTAFWFAPILTAWNGMGAAQALFFSFFGCWRNWRAFVVYAAAVAGAAFAISLLIALLAAAGGNLDAARGMKLGVTLMLLPTLFGSFYAAYRDIFPEDVPDAPAGAEPPGPQAA
ncbi:MAG: hypothetical protein IT514_08940 [Burkholderiales bacterium]|nr:hypothetical protein [Burkholderiales bacterium]